MLDRHVKRSASSSGCLSAPALDHTCLNFGGAKHSSAKGHCCCIRPIVSAFAATTFAGVRAQTELMWYGELVLRQIPEQDASKKQEHVTLAKNKVSLLQLQSKYSSSTVEIST